MLLLVSLSSLVFLFIHLLFHPYGFVLILFILNSSSIQHWLSYSVDGTVVRDVTVTRSNIADFVHALNVYRIFACTTPSVCDISSTP
jgi:hypothetical protein